jgi:uncharacterized protein (TIGR02231 family)
MEASRSLPPPKSRGVLRAQVAMPRKEAADTRRGAEPPEPPCGQEHAAPAAVEPADAWLDFDGLTLAPGDARARRGRLVRAATDRRRGLLAAKAAEIENALPASRPRDPQTARGQFDHRYDADGTVDVPSNGIPHRIVLGSAKTTTRRRFRTLPITGTEVFREALLDNPFPAPLLGGPVEVFMDGGLLATPRIDPVGRGGPLALGLGIEDRLRVSRNARVEESSRGMLGGTTGVEHDIEIEVASALGRAIELEVLDRIPVTDDKDAKISLLRSEPKAAEYDQADRGAPIRGGLCWNLKVPAGGKAGIKWSYRIDLPAKSEVVGGNRRD